MGGIAKGNRGGKSRGLLSRSESLVFEGEEKKKVTKGVFGQGTNL